MGGDDLNFDAGDIRNSPVKTEVNGTVAIGGEI